MSFNNPRQIILVSSGAEVEIMGKTIEKDDIITIAWHMPVSFEPKMYAIAVGKTRFSNKLISMSKAFVVNYISYALKDEAVFCGTHHGEHMDKFKESGLTKEKSDNVHCPRIKEAIGYLECEVINEVEAGDHIIYIGKVAGSELKREAKRLFQKDSKGTFTTTED